MSNKEVTLISQATFVPGKKKIRPTTSAVVFGDLGSGIGFVDLNLPPKFE